MKGRKTDIKGSEGRGKGDGIGKARGRVGEGREGKGGEWTADS